MKKDLISIKDLSKNEIGELFELAKELKQEPSAYYEKLKGRSLGLIFQKPSNRTRVSFEVGMHQFGGYTVYLGPDDIKLGVRETTKDIALTLSRYLDVIVARTFSHQDIVELAENATIPVINGLSDLLHPCQALADIFTIKEKSDKLEGVKLAFIGDGNNVVHSLLYCGAKMGLNISLATPRGYEPDTSILEESKTIAEKTGANIDIVKDKHRAVEDADVIYTDVWVSMGQEAERKKRLKAFKDFQINSELLSKAKKDCIVMHCLPAHRGEEITGEVIDGPNSIVFDQAENRLHIQKAILLKLLDKGV
ncbi:MAG: ornithine carbamoyltransferase [Candidatus Omnitrophica bacterium]|nr:ornithine carbamoyltransferase [Candidatus Omnitrophota bacterium]